MTTAAQRSLILRRALAFVMFCVACSLGYFGLWARRARAVWDAAPEGSLLLVSVDAEALRRTPLRAPLSGWLDRQLRLPTACPLRPGEHVDTMLLSIPDGERRELALALTGRATGEELDACKRALVREPARAATRIGEFDVSGDDTMRIALGARGPLIIGRGAHVDELARVASGEAPHVADASIHQVLRGRLRARASREPWLLATCALSKRLRAALGTFLGARGDDPKGLALLQLEGLGVAVTHHEGRKEIELLFEAQCETDEACRQTREFLMARRFELGGKLPVRLAGFGHLLDAFVAETTGTQASAQTRDDAESAARALENLLRYLESEPGPTLMPKPPSPDEVLRPQPSAPPK